MPCLFSLLLIIVMMSTLLSYRPLLMVGFCVVLNTLCAQSPSYYRYTTADGLPTNYVYGVVEDKDGYIWAYTENGLAKFDGYTFQHYTTADGLPGNDITWALRAPDDKIWLYAYKNRPAYLLNDSAHIVDDAPAALITLLPSGTPSYSSEGLLRTYDKHWKTLLNPYSFTTKELTRFGQEWRAKQSYPNTPFHRESVQGIHTATKDSITTWEVGRHEVLKYPRTTSDCFYLFNDSLLWQEEQQWFGVPNIKIDSILQITKYASFPAQPSKWIFRMGRPLGEYLFLNTRNGQAQRLSVTDYGLQPAYYTDFSIREATVWLESDAGSVQLDYSGQLLNKLVWTSKEQAWTPLRTYTDGEGNIWQGTRNGGLLMIPFAYQGVRKRNLPTSGNQYLKRLLRTPDDRIIGITENGQIYDIGTDTIRSIYQPASEKHFRTAIWLEEELCLSLSDELLLLNIGASATKVQSITTILNDNYCLGIQSSVPFTKASFVATNFTSAVYLAEKKQLFSIPGYNVIFRWDLVPVDGEPCQITVLADKASLLYLHPQTGTIYGGDIDGLSIIENEKLVPFLPHEAELKNISALFGTPGMLWIGTESNGLFRYDFDTQKLKKIISNNHIRAIRPDGKRGVVLATNNGIFTVPTQQPENYQQFTHLDGLPTLEIDDVFALGDSVLLVASNEGLYELQRRKHQLPTPAKNAFQLKTIAANGSPVSAEALTKLPYTTNQLDFAFLLRSYASKGHIHYQTRLEPLEADWQESPERSRRYSGLRPGEYRFHVAAIDIYGRRFELPPTLIYIRSALWQRWWFQALLMVGLLALATGIVLRRLQLTKRQLANEQALNRRLAVMELEALKAQMNPHFIFNALGSIQYFIQTQEVDLADDYLTRFASLMRQYLDSSRETLLPLEQEIALLTNYTDLEQMRFEELFRVAIKVPGELLKSGLQVPTMIIQPFVENAINHGLSERRDGQGYLSIHFSQIDQDTLCCTITDNGIGRKRAGQRTRAGHHSRGMQIVQDKIDTLAAADLVKVSYTITEAEPEQEEYPGTQVTIYFKFLEDGNN